MKTALPCPFCGAQTPTLVQSDFGMQYARMVCSNEECGAGGPHTLDGEGAAIRLWNGDREEAVRLGAVAWAATNFVIRRWEILDSPPDLGEAGKFELARAEAAAFLVLDTEVDGVANLVARLGERA